MNDVVFPWCRTQKIEVKHSRAYKKNDQAFVDRKNGAVVRSLAETFAFMASRRPACWNACMPHSRLTSTSSSRPSN